MNVKELLGRPDFTAGKFSGYVLWKQSDGFHLRWANKKKKKQTFQGKIICSDKVKISKVTRKENVYKINETQKNTIEWNATLEEGVDGFDFLTPGDFEVELRVESKKIKPKTIFLGSDMKQVDKNPFKILQPTGELILGDEIKKDEPVIEEVKKETQKAVEPVESIYETKSMVDFDRLEEDKMEEKEAEVVPFEAAPLPIPAKEYEVLSEKVPDKQPEEIPSDELEIRIEPTLSIEKPEDEPEKRIFDWLTQLLTYRDFSPKEKKDILNYEILPENIPNASFEMLSIEETQIRLDIEPRNVELQEKPPEMSAKSLDEMEVRINQWLTQLLKYRKFN